MLLAAFIGMTLPISVIGLALTAIYYAWVLLHGFPIGWGIAGILYCLYYMAGAYRMMTFLNGQTGIHANARAAACLPFAIQLIAAMYFATSTWPFVISAWWALLLPLTFLLQLLLQGGAEFILDIVSPAGKRD